MGGHGVVLRPPARDQHRAEARPGDAEARRPLRDYQFSLETPAPAGGQLRPAAAARGEQVVFDGAGKCATCHIPPLYTDVNRGVLHDPAETGMDPAYAQRTTTKKYRTTPLRGALAAPAVLP